MLSDYHTSLITQIVLSLLYIIIFWIVLYYTVLVNIPMIRDILHLDQKKPKSKNCIEYRLKRYPNIRRKK